MSNSIRTRNSKQGLQNLLRVTAQRSLEDAEEIERERRRRARDQRGQRSVCRSLTPPQDSASLTQEPVWDMQVKPTCQLVLEEDEGFSDWTHKLENRKQAKQKEPEVQENHRTQEERPCKPRQTSDPREEEEEDRQEEGWEPTGNSRICDKRKEVKISYSSTVLMQQEARQRHRDNQTADRTSYLVAGRMRPCCSPSLADHRDREVAEAGEERERRLEEEKEEQEVEELRLRKEWGLMGDLHLSMEDRYRAMETMAELRPFQEEEESQRRTEERGTRNMRDTLSISNNEGDGPSNLYGPMSPTFKKLLIRFYPNEIESRVTPDSTYTINEITESLSRSMNRKKTMPPTAVSKIENRLEQYTDAIKISSKDVKAAKPVLIDLPSPTEPVASKKNLFEAGDAWSQNSTRVTQSKDADGLKVGVAELINQWVKGNPDDTMSSSPSKPAEIKPGDVLNKKNLWENLGDTASSGREGKGSSGKRYRFVVTGHGKYHKVPVDDDNYSEYYQSDGQFREDL
ncbi:uncharacterized protein ACJ7VT_019089 [Polymixia lowei]